MEKVDVILRRSVFYFLIVCFVGGSVSYLCVVSELLLRFVTVPPLYPFKQSPFALLWQMVDKCVCVLYFFG